MAHRTLRCHRVRFYSHGDEAAFFAFAQSIAGVLRVYGEKDAILIDTAFLLLEDSLRDVLALFWRYQINDMTQLSAFLTSANEGWFAAPLNYWHQQVFGAGRA